MLSGTNTARTFWLRTITTASGFPLPEPSSSQWSKRHPVFAVEVSVTGTPAAKTAADGVRETVPEPLTGVASRNPEVGAAWTGELSPTRATEASSTAAATNVNLRKVRAIDACIGIPFALLDHLPGAAR